MTPTRQTVQCLPLSTQRQSLHKRAAHFVAHCVREQGHLISAQAEHLEGWGSGISPEQYKQRCFRRGMASGRERRKKMICATSALFSSLHSAHPASRRAVRRAASFAADGFFASMRAHLCPGDV